MAERFANRVGAAEAATNQTPTSSIRNPFADSGEVSSSSSTRSESLDERQGASRAVVHDTRPEPPIRASTLPAVTNQDEITPAPDTAQELEFNEKAEYKQENPQGDVPTSTNPEKQDAAAGPAAEAKKKNIFKRAYLHFRASYAPLHDAALILPSGTTDEEKYSYLKMNRLPLYTLGVFSFLALSAGMWLFVITSPAFYWFGVLVAALEIYLIISYSITIVGKDYDFEGHKKILEGHPITPETAPTVDIFLPCCKEPLEILANTYKYVSALQWPEGKLKVHVMDDGNMEAVKVLAESFGFHYSVREDRPRLKKAGNLRWTFARTEGEFFTIFDADFCPRPDFLMELIPQHLADDKTAIIQSPQFFRITKEQTWVEQGAGGIQELFYRVVEVNRNRWGASICVGSNAVYRRAALEEVGGTAEIGFSEDVHTGFYALTRGWKVKYVPLCLACGVCPDTPQAFFSQQMRWCMGSTTLLSNPDFWKSKLSLIQKLCYLSGFMYYSAISLSIFINPLPGMLLLWVRPEYFKYYNLAFAVPSIFYSLLALRFWAKGAYSLNVQYIMVIQSYAYLTAIKDRIFGRALAWVPSGDNKSHRNTKYRNMRILAFCWIFTYLGLLIGAIVYRNITDDDFHVYNAVPLLVLDSMNLFFAHRFLFCVSTKKS